MSTVRELTERLAQLEATVQRHDALIKAAQSMFSPLDAAMSEAFLDMVLKTNPINQEEKEALELIRRDRTAAPISALTLGLHAAEREILDGELGPEEHTAYVGALIVIRAELVKRGVYVETGEKEVRAALKSADDAGRVQAEKPE